MCAIQYNLQSPISKVYMNTFISYLNIYIYIETIDNGETMLICEA